MVPKVILNNSVAKPTVYLPAWECIYCRRKDVELTKEHIIPLALNGALILPKASCKKCQKIIHEFETVCIKENFDSFRAHFKFRSRRPDKRRTHFPIHPVGSPPFGPSSKMVPLSTFKPPLFLPKLPPPSILTFGAPSPIGYFKEVAAIDEASMQALNRQFGPSAISQKFNVKAFILTLAKIAHGFAWAIIGPERFTHMLPELILGRDYTLMPYLVGGLYPGTGIRNITGDNALSFGILGTNHGPVVHVSISLFHKFPVPQYTVIVGKWIGEPEFLAKLGVEVVGTDVRVIPQ